MQKYPDSFYNPFGSGGMFIILLIGFIGLAYQHCTSWLGF